MKRLLPLVLLLVAAPARAQEADPLKHLAPYLAEDTVLVGRLDIKNIDIDQVRSRLAKIGVEPEQLDQSKAMASQLRERLLAVGAKHVYFTNVGMPFGFEILAVIPSNDSQAVVQALDVKSPLKTRVAGNVVLVGSPKALEAAGKVVARTNPEWAKILPKLDAYPSYVAVLPPRALTRVFVELQPELPKEIGGGPTQPLVDGIRWAGAGIDLSEKLKVELSLVTADEAAAKTIEPVLERAIAFVKNSREAKEVPPLQKLLENHRPKRDGDRFTLALDAAAIDSVLIPAAGKARQAAATQQSMNNLRQIGLAMHVYHDANKTFPPQATVDKAKRPLLSWRVQILPYIEQDALYREFRQDEPWDSEHNKKLIAKMPKIYRSPFSKTKPEDGITTYVVPSGPKAFFNDGARKKIVDITDGTSNTIMTLDVDDSKGVVWTRPDDYPVDPKKANVGVFRAGNRIMAGFFDGSVRQLSPQTSDEILWLYFCPDDGTPIPLEK